MKDTYTRREMVVVLSVMVILLLVMFSLSLDLRQARNNERTLSHMLYEIGKTGRVTTNYNEK